MLRFLAKTALSLLMLATVCGALLLMKYFMLYRAPEMDRSALMDQLKIESPDPTIVVETPIPGLHRLSASGDVGKRPLSID